jgi:bifunctional lysine-specific demethylase and histidyl-hydroxylase NO66
MKNPKVASELPADETSGDVDTHEIDVTNEEVQKCMLKLRGHSLMAILEADNISSKLRSQSAMQYLLHPTTLSEFQAQFFESQPLLNNRNELTYFNGLFSKDAFAAIINQNVLSLGSDINITKHQSNGLLLLTPRVNSSELEWMKENEQPDVDEGQEVSSSVVWQRFKSGGVLQLLCPEKYSDPLWKFISYLEGFMNAKIYCHSFLIPAASVGYGLRSFSSDRYIVQVEGTSNISVYKPSTVNAQLPREGIISVSATDYLNSGSITTVLQPGDSLYIPKGWVHSVEGCGGKPSVSVHLLTNEHNSIADLVDIALPQALAHRIAETVDFRRALPRNIGEFMGVSAAVQEDDLSDEEDEEDAAAAGAEAEKRRRALLLQTRQQFKKKVAQLLHQVVDDAVDMLDASVDQIMKGLMGARLPPALTAAEEERTKFGPQARRIGPFTKLCAVRENAARVCVEDGVVVLYHCLDNGREVFSNPLSPVEYDLDDGPAIEKLLGAAYVPLAEASGDDSGEEGAAVNCGVMVTDLPHTSEELHDKVGIAESLYREGLLMVVDEDSPGETHRLAGGASAPPKRSKEAGKVAPDSLVVAERLMQEYSVEKKHGVSAGPVGDDEKVEKVVKKKKEETKEKSKKRPAGDKGMEQFLAGVSKRTEDRQKKAKISEDDEDCPF